MSSHDSLGDRMKAYEASYRTVMPHRLPIIIRIDGKAFHTYTAGCKRPFDERLSDVMISTAKELCKQIQGCQIAYTQSDEISLLVHGYKRFTSQSWFDNQLQKMVSVAAGLASAHFTAESWKIWSEVDPDRGFTWPPAIDDIRPAVFDARAFVVPEADVNNYFLWRQQDARRNSVQVLARNVFSHKQCENKNVEQLKKMCEEKGFAWDNLDVRWRRGICVRRGVETPYDGSVPSEKRHNWYADITPPLFNVDVAYINDLLKLDEG